jgi:hypothetical protein
MNACDIHGSSGISMSVESVIANHAPNVVGRVPGCSNSAGIFINCGRVLYLPNTIMWLCTLSTLCVYFIYFEVLYLPFEVLYLPFEVLYLPQHPLSLTASKAKRVSPIYLYTYT